MDIDDLTKGRTPSCRAFGFWMGVAGALPFVLMELRKAAGQARQQRA